MEDNKKDILNNTAENEGVMTAADLPESDFAVQGNAEAVSAVAVSINDEQSQAAKKPEKSGEFISDNVRIVSPFKLVLKRFFRSKLSVVGLAMFLAVVVFAFLGPVFVSWEEEEVDRSPAQRIVYEYASYTESDGEDGEYTYYIVSINRPMNLNKHAAAFTYGVNKKGDKALHLLGTDGTGYDILVRLMYGGRLSLMLSFLVVLVYTLIGIVLGGLAGYFGGWVDMIIMRLVDILNCLPSLPIMLILGAFFDGSGMSESVRVYFMMGVLTLMSWTGTARLVRGQILMLREQEYMVATDALGFSPWRKIFKHLVPNVMPQLIVSMTLGLGGTILTEASLSFLNLGAPEQVASLGRMVNSAKDPMVLTNYIMDWMPAGFIIILAVVAFNFIGDGLRDALDPKMKR